MFNDREKVALLRRLAQTRGIVVFTDADGAGFVIRDHLRGALGKRGVLHAYTPDVYGKEKRKKKGGKEGKLGVEGMRPEVLLESLRRAGATFEGEESPRLPRRGEKKIEKADLLDAGLVGDGSKAHRAALVKELDLPEQLSVNQLMEVLNLLMTRDEFLERYCQTR